MVLDESRHPRNPPNWYPASIAGFASSNNPSSLVVISNNENAYCLRPFPVITQAGNKVLKIPSALHAKKKSQMMP